MSSFESQISLPLRSNLTYDLCSFASCEAGDGARSTADEILRECENLSYIDDLRHHGTTRLEDPEPVLYDLSSLIDRLLGMPQKYLLINKLIASLIWSS